jgi:glycosyltransferase involved in cell wall biosynthesis
VLGGAGAFFGTLQAHHEHLRRRVLRAVEERAPEQRRVPVSVVIPALEEEKYLPSCLKSLLNGTAVPDETIVVDSGSGDRTVEVARSFGCRVLYSPRGEFLWGRSGSEDERHVWTTGVAEARNRGGREARNGTILFTDADTVFEWHAVERLLDVLARRDAAVTHPLIVLTDGPLHVAWWWHTQILALNLRVASRTQMVRREDFLRAGGFRYMFNEDNDFAKRVAGLRPGGMQFVMDAVIGTSARRMSFFGWTWREHTPR